MVQHKNIGLLNQLPAHQVIFRMQNKKGRIGPPPPLRIKKGFRARETLPARHERTKAMTTIDCCETVKPTGARAELAAFAAVATVEKAASMFRAWQNRRELYKLGDLNDRELADIGLSRCGPVRRPRCAGAC